MSKSKKFESIKHEEDYLEFLRKRVFSLNYKKNVSDEEYAKTKAKYDKVKLKMKLLKV